MSFILRHHNRTGEKKHDWQRCYPAVCWGDSCWEKKTLVMVHPPNLLKSKLSLENKQVHGLLGSFPFRKPKKNSKEVVIHHVKTASGVVVSRFRPVA